MILNPELNSNNRITAINSLAIPVITYSFNIIDWNLSEVKRLDIKIKIDENAQHASPKGQYSVFNSEGVMGERFDSTRIVL